MSKNNHHLNMDSRNSTITGLPNTVIQATLTDIPSVALPAWRAHIELTSRDSNTPRSRIFVLSRHGFRPASSQTIAALPSHQSHPSSSSTNLDPPSSTSTSRATSSAMVVEVKRTVKIVTEQATIPGRTPEVEGYPMKLWNIEIYLLDDTGKETDASIFTKAVYNLHPSFANPVQTFEKPPFRCENEGWGEFDMTIDLYAAEKGGKHTLMHDLNFAKARYESKHVIVFKNPNANLLGLLAKSGPVPGDDVNGARKKQSDDIKKRKRGAQVDMDKLADGLVKLQEDDLLQVVQMIHDNKSEETYTKNDVEAGEFHVDLYTMPDNLVRMLWDLVQAKVY